MKEIKKIAFMGFWRNFNPENALVLNFLREKYEVIITDYKRADYVFYSAFTQKHWLVPDRCIKIFFTGEMVTPDFNGCDYAIGFDWLSYGDRYFRMPIRCRYPEHCESMVMQHSLPLEEKIRNKTEFCSITVSNTNRDPFFNDLYDELTKYKKINSGGKWNNNVGGRVKDKLSFDSTHKFSVVFENSSFPGYLTEKILKAFKANCIPIYWGDPLVTRVFNGKAFVNVHDYSSVKEVVEVVKQIDSDDELYHEMLSEPLFSKNCSSGDEQMRDYRIFINHIFDQPMSQAVRRNRMAWGKIYVKQRVLEYICSIPYRAFRKIMRRVRRCL